MDPVDRLIALVLVPVIHSRPARFTFAATDRDRGGGT